MTSFLGSADRPINFNPNSQLSDLDPNSGITSNVISNNPQTISIPLGPPVPIATDTNTLLNQTRVTSSNIIEQAQSFTISFLDNTNTKKTYYFSLLPAIENNIKNSSFGATVPEIKPGILIKTTMNVKKFLIPGCFPAIQPLGIGQTIIQLVGLFIGTEGTTQINTFESVLTGTNPSNLITTTAVNAYNSALYFNNNVVHSSRPVDLFIRGSFSDNNYQPQIGYTGVIQDYRMFVTRSDRTYYALDILVTNYSSTLS
jgi:hypothetical protein